MLALTGWFGVHGVSVKPLMERFWRPAARR
jgi:hypothetical protein